MKERLDGRREEPGWSWFSRLLLRLLFYNSEVCFSTIQYVSPRPATVSFKFLRLTKGIHTLSKNILI